MHDVLIVTNDVPIDLILYIVSDIAEPNKMSRSGSEEKFSRAGIHSSETMRSGQTGIWRGAEGM